MSIYKYETHLHTSQGSACGQSLGREYIEVYAKAGYKGVFITDHFFGGNVVVEARSGNWEDRVNIYCSGYEDAVAACKEYNQKNGLTGTDKEFQVFFGIEQTFNGDDYLIYGLTKEWLLSHPDVETMNHRELFMAVNMTGGLMIQAHPFRLRDYIQAIHVHPRECHGVEVYNAGNRPEENELAALYAKQYNFPVTSGSDNHCKDWVPMMPNGLPIGGMEFDSPLTDVMDYVGRIKEKKGRIMNNV